MACTTCIGGTTNCDACDNTGACTTFSTNFYVTSYGTYTCTEGSTNCHSCDSSGSCIVCDTHFYPVNGICTPCIG